MTSALPDVSAASLDELVARALAGELIPRSEVEALALRDGADQATAVRDIEQHLHEIATREGARSTTERVAAQLRRMLTVKWLAMPAVAELDALLQRAAAGHDVPRSAIKALPIAPDVDRDYATLSIESCIGEIKRRRTWSTAAASNLAALYARALGAEILEAGS